MTTKSPEEVQLQLMEFQIEIDALFMSTVLRTKAKAKASVTKVMVGFKLIQLQKHFFMSWYMTASHFTCRSSLCGALVSTLLQWK